ncbi:hypothetical protein CN309_05310 [Bacillus thuringiensis]|uniref:ImmA/IrrE family metallo-endopeptidase n=1 Tax=Bacillus thuringiensis TaxID=1428 RepID=UPI000BF5190A|nr:ImmA/IrrE family metallo-endopeptidase [Bacillus thuringiensis]PFD67685.1 hypothetical protein CN309_05310 [Bacillus thuringiensis]
MAFLKKMNIKADFNLVRQEVLHVIKHNNIHSLPINLMDIIQNYENLEIFSYEEFAIKTNLTVTEVKEISLSEEGCLIYKPTGKKGQYIILYNNAPTQTFERKRFTIAHELGHFFLKHNEITQKTTLSRYSLSNNQYEEFEKEANMFARYLLTPPPVLKKLSMEWGGINYRDIMDICNVSMEVSQNTIRYLHKTYSFSYYPEIEKRFIQYIASKYCLVCGCYPLYGSTFCPICSAESMKKGKGTMKYKSTLRLDKNSRALKCPCCDNEGLDYEGDYCKICGSYLVNKCSNTDRISPSNFHYIQDSCDTKLASNARHCHKCGNESTFFQQGFLLIWNKEHLATKQIQPFFTVSVSNDDPPF